ncbi:hypothetical protein BC826DRAFT_543857 [Russula brevipes]|nr:hypothetical protein BC826DRAFT_543857 [Russula brevipes]
MGPTLAGMWLRDRHRECVSVSHRDHDPGPGYDDCQRSCLLFATVLIGSHGQPLCNLQQASLRAACGILRLSYGHQLYGAWGVLRQRVCFIVSEAGAGYAQDAVRCVLSDIPAIMYPITFSGRFDTGSMV